MEVINGRYKGKPFYRYKFNSLAELGDYVSDVSVNNYSRQDTYNDWFGCSFDDALKYSEFGCHELVDQLSNKVEAISQKADILNVSLRLLPIALPVSGPWSFAIPAVSNP